MAAYVGDVTSRSGTSVVGAPSSAGDPPLAGEGAGAGDTAGAGGVYAGADEVVGGGGGGGGVEVELGTTGGV